MFGISLADTQAIINVMKDRIVRLKVYIVS